MQDDQGLLTLRGIKAMEKCQDWMAMWRMVMNICKTLHKIVFSMVKFQLDECVW